MTLEEVVAHIERPYCREAVEICGADDDGKLAILLGRHGARVVVVVPTEADKLRLDSIKPQALNIRVVVGQSLMKADSYWHVRVSQDQKYDVEYKKI